MRTHRHAVRALVCVALLACVAAPGLADPEVLAAFAEDRDGLREAALLLAREAFDTYCLDRERIAPPTDLPPVFRLRSGVFVSASLNGAPRCCMGALYPTRQTLAEEIIAAAVAAAGLDYRFPPLRPEELDRVRLIVSVVGPPQAIGDVSEIDPATEGLVARRGDKIGVVLPGETRHLERAVRWARVRAGVPPEAEPDYYRLQAVRMMEPKRARR